MNGSGSRANLLPGYDSLEQNGWLLDFASTAVLANLELSAGSLSAESGTDYFDLPVPEPAEPVLVLVGVALVAALGDPVEDRRARR